MAALFGNVRRKVQAMGGQSLVLKYRYNLANRLIGMTYPSGLEVSYSRDVQGRISAVERERRITSLPLVSAVSYKPFGPVSAISFGDGQKLGKGWDQNYWPTGVSGDALDYTFTTNDVGNITQVTSTSEGIQNLGHDRLDRLNEVRDQNSALIEAYGYDATGNRQSQTIGNVSTAYQYEQTSHRLIEVGASARGHDSVGNTTTGMPWLNALSSQSGWANYDVRNRLVGASAPRLTNAISYEYNDRGERVRKRVEEVTGALTQNYQNYAYDEAGQRLGVYTLEKVDSTSWMAAEEVIWLDNTPIARIESTDAAIGNVHFIHSDHLNTPRALTEAQHQSDQTSGIVVWRWPLVSQTATGTNSFGTQPALNDPDGDRNLITFDLRFPGQQYDAESGLHYNHFRDYEPGTGRHVESDPIGLDGGISTYNYSKGAPLVRFDSRGLFSFGASCTSNQRDQILTEWVSINLELMDKCNSGCAECSMCDR